MGGEPGRVPGWAQGQDHAFSLPFLVLHFPSEVRRDLSRLHPLRVCRWEGGKDR